MKIQHPQIIFAILFLLTPLTLAILTKPEERPITDDARFGCHWQGGSTPGLTCICRSDAEEMYIRKKSISSYDTGHITITSCKKVRFGPESVAEMRTLRFITLQNIDSLVFEEHSVTWSGYRDTSNFEDLNDRSIPSLKINIENSTIAQISAYTFEGRIASIYFEKVIIENAEPFAFNSLIQTQEITWKDVVLKNAREQTLKKFYTQHLELNNVQGQLIPSRFIHNITVFRTFKITNCVFDTVRSGAFIVSTPENFEVTGSRINHLYGEAFKVITKGDVVFRNNQFGVINDGAFRAILLDDEIPERTITFDSNVFTTITRDSLGINEKFRPKFTNMYINETCDCKSIDHNIKQTNFYSEIKCKSDSEYITVQNYKTNKCSIIESYSNVIIIVAIVCTLCFIIIVVLVIYYRRVYLSKKYGNEKNSKKGNMSLIVPDGRTYRETELHVIVERADLLTTDL